MKRVIHVFSCLMCLIFCIIMLNAGIESIENIRWSEQTTPAMQIPAWIIWLAMPLGFALMGIHAVIRIIGIIRTPDTDIPLRDEQAEAAH